jgi:hypothetical protein
MNIYQINIVYMNIYQINIVYMNIYQINIVYMNIYQINIVYMNIYQIFETYLRTAEKLEVLFIAKCYKRVFIRFMFIRIQRISSIETYSRRFHYRILASGLQKHLEHTVAADNVH